MLDQSFAAVSARVLPGIHFICLQLWQMLAISAVSKCPWTKSEADPEFKVKLI